jgi:hypothetical protein
MAPIKTSMLAGMAYFALVFALGFVLGTARTFVLQAAPSHGRLLGVLIELPVMLSASWYVCRYLMRRFSVAPTMAARATMGGIAFLLLLMAEMLLGALLFGRTFGEQWALYREPSYALGLAAQMGFAVMPLMQARRMSKP